jgi:hypothetical protein
MLYCYGIFHIKCIGGIADMFGSQEIYVSLTAKILLLIYTSSDVAKCFHYIVMWSCSQKCIGDIIDTFCVWLLHSGRIHVTLHGLVEQVQTHMHTCNVREKLFVTAFIRGNSALPVTLNWDGKYLKNNPLY